VSSFDSKKEILLKCFPALSFLPLSLTFARMSQLKNENFGDRPDKLIAAFKALDSGKTGKIPTALLSKLLNAHGHDFSAEEKKELYSEADDNGFVYYEKFVRDIIFGKLH
jgi:Ca2+-binding EF-hand superfamily protein